MTVRFIYSENGINLSHLGTIGFNKTLNRKYLRMNLESSKISQSIIASHFVIRLPVTSEEVSNQTFDFSKYLR